MTRITKTNLIEILLVISILIAIGYAIRLEYKKMHPVNINPPKFNINDWIVIDGTSITGKVDKIYLDETGIRFYHVIYDFGEKNISETGLKPIERK